MEAHLFPKLRCYFAEFLNQVSLKRLGILSLPTCVGLRYGHQDDSLRGFSWKRGFNHFMGASSLVVTSRSYGPADLPTEPSYRLKPGRPTPGWSTLLRHPFADNVALVAREY